MLKSLTQRASLRAFWADMVFMWSKMLQTKFTVLYYSLLSLPSRATASMTALNLSGEATLKSASFMIISCSSYTS